MINSFSVTKEDIGRFEKDAWLMGQPASGRAILDLCSFVGELIEALEGLYESSSPAARSCAKDLLGQYFKNDEKALRYYEYLQEEKGLRCSDGI